MGKPTIPQLRLRIEEVKQLLYQGHDYASIVHHSAQRWGVSRRTVSNYVSRARQQMADEVDTARPFLLAEHIAHRRELRRQFRDRDDLHGELKAAQDEAKLLSLYELTVNVNGWQERIIAGLRDGTITPDMIEGRFPPDLVQEFFVKAGVHVG